MHIPSVVGSFFLLLLWTTFSKAEYLGKVSLKGCEVGPPFSNIRLGLATGVDVGGLRAATGGGAVIEFILDIWDNK